MEFLATYGWAILIVIIVIGALSYSGTISPDKILPEKCTLPAQFSCEDFRMVKTGGGGGDTIYMKVRNKASRAIAVIKVTFSSEALSGVCGQDFSASPIVLRNTESGLVGGLGCILIDTGKTKNKVNVQIDYRWLDSSLMHTVDGELYGKVER